MADIVLVYAVIHIIFLTLDHDGNHQDADKLGKRRQVLLFLAILMQHSLIKLD